MSTLKVPATFTGFASKVDGSASLRFSTQEISSADFAVLKENLNQFGWLVFRGNEDGVPDMPTEDAEEGSKTPAQRMRAILFIEWKQKGKEGDFEGYYRQRMDAICERLKGQLDQ